MKRLVPILLLCTACENIIEIAPPDYDSEIAVSSYFTPDSIWTARISQTIPVGQAQNIGSPFLDNALVAVWQGDQLVDRLANDGSDTGWYVSTNAKRPQPNTSYRLTVEVPGFALAEASSSVPAAPRLSQTSISLQSGASTSEEHKFTVRFRLEDGIGANYYSFSTYFAVLFEDADVQDYHIYEAYMERDDPTWHCNYEDALNPVQSGFESGSAESEGCGTAIMTDRLFSEAEREFEYTVAVHESLVTSETIIAVFVSSMSEDYFEYQRSLEISRDEDPFSEPAQVYSNFKGGRGVFAGYVTLYQILSLPEAQ